MFKRPVNIVRIQKSKTEKMQDIVLVERDVELILNSESLVNIICLPKDLKELSIGFLYSIGIISKLNNIKKVEVDDMENRIYVELKESIKFNIKNLNINPISRVMDTSCGISSPWRSIIKNALEREKKSLRLQNNLSINKDLIFSSIKQMQRETSLYRETGGCHGAAIFSQQGKLISVKEDIGRHNAIDKVIGDILLKNQDFKDKFLTTTGRLTGDSVLKAVRANIPIVASLSAAVESGVRLAFVYGITLIGFVRGQRMNIYTHPERIET